MPVSACSASAAPTMNLSAALTVIALGGYKKSKETLVQEERAVNRQGMNRAGSIAEAGVLVLVVMLVLPTIPECLADGHSSTFFTVSPPGLADPLGRLAQEETYCGPRKSFTELRSLECSGAFVCLNSETGQEQAGELFRQLSIPTLSETSANGKTADRWTYTATNGSTGVEGDPVTLTWSFVPDGTLVDGVPSVLDSVFDDLLKSKIRRAFDLWDAATGIKFIEVEDDGADLPNSPGVLGARGDIRIAGRSIDGEGNVVIYSYYPDVGDIVLDTDDIGFFSNPLLNYRTLKNVVGYEIGHCIGLGNVIPTDCTKLMESGLCLGFTGPQHDDTRRAQRLYGDPLENNDVVEDASDLGSLAESLLVEGLSLDHGGDDDWYLFTSSQCSITVEVEPTGFCYEVGPAGGVISVICTDSILDLGFYLHDSTGVVVLDSATSGGLGETESLTGFLLPYAGEFRLRVENTDAGNGTQMYALSLTSRPTASIRIADKDIPSQSDPRFSVYPNPVNTKMTARFFSHCSDPYVLEVYDVSGRLVRKIRKWSTGAGWTETQWDGTACDGRQVKGGVYFISLKIGGRVETRKVVLP
jgi:hypothetical protein